MNDEAKAVARAAAKKMEGSGHSGLPLKVEEAIANQNTGQMTDSVALAALIVSTAGFAWRMAWDIYLEYRKRELERTDAGLRASIEKIVKEELESSEIADQATRALLIEATTDAVMARLAASR